MGDIAAPSTRAARLVVEYRTCQKDKGKEGQPHRRAVYCAKSRLDEFILHDREEYLVENKCDKRRQ